MSAATPAPAILPLFPLTGTLLLPGSLLPLNVFEPRYRHLVADALAEGNHIGMIQPLVPRLDNFGALLDPPDEERAPALYQVGCAGKIEHNEEQPDGRYEIVLRGVCRFRIRDELEERHGYRQVAADYCGFESDPAELQVAVDPGPMLATLRAFGTRHGLDFDFDLLAALPGISLLNGLAVALPFRPEEKQALLEAGGPMEREQLLLTLMGMGLAPMSAETYFAPPTVH